MTRARDLSIGGALLLGSVIACARERARLAPPRLTLELAAGPVCGGCNVVGTATAVDGDGVTYIAVEARSAADTVDRRTFNLIPRESVTVSFTLRTAVNAEPGSLVVVTATAIDEQLLTTRRVDTTFVQRP